MEVRRWSWLVRYASAGFWVMFGTLCLLLLPVKPGLAVLLSAVSLAGLIAVDMVEPTIERHAFPQLAAMSGPVVRKIRLRELVARMTRGKTEVELDLEARHKIALTQLLFLVLLLLPFARGRISLEHLLREQGPKLDLSDLWVQLFAFFSFLGVATFTESAVELWRNQKGAIGKFRRWFPVYLVLELLGTANWLLTSWTPVFINIAVVLSLLMLPFAQLRWAREALGTDSAPSLPASLSRERRLGLIMAAAQFFLAGLFAVAVFALSKALEFVVAAMALPLRHSDEPAWVPTVIWVLFILLVLLTIAWTITAIEMLRRPVPMARTLQRWFLYFFVLDSIAAWMGFAFIPMMGLELMRHLALGFFLFIAVLAVPFGQALIAAQLAPGSRPSRLELFLPWLKRGTPETQPKAT